MKEEILWPVVVGLLVIGATVVLSIGVKGCNERVTACYDKVTNPAAQVAICGRVS